MTVHRNHPIDGDDPEAVLFEDCDRCAEHAKNVLGLDRGTLTAIASRPPKNDCEADVLRVIADAFELVKTVLEVRREL